MNKPEMLVHLKKKEIIRKACCGDFSWDYADENI